ncbi:MAG: O-antigen ligase family protein [Planctomycetes bacterium]|nr:O-antigen ligase family protein [Planctomycetota bacterium]
MYLWLELFLISAGITARLIIPASTCGSGVNLLVVILIWLVFLVHLMEKQKLTAVTPALPWFLKLLLFLFAAFIIVSFINAPYKFGAFQYLVPWISDVVLFYLVYSLCARDAKYITTLLSVFLSVGLMVVLYGLYQHFWGLRDLAVQIQQNPSLLDAIPAELRGATLARAQAGEPFATFAYQNSFGAFLILLIPLFLALLYIGRRVMLIIAGVLTLTLLMSGSKGALMALMIPLMFLAYYLPGRLSKQVRIILLAVILAVFMVAVIMGRSQMSDSLNVRLGYLDATVKIIRDNPLSGVGLNQFGNNYLHYKSVDAGEVQKAHNDYLQIAAEMGIPALLVFLVIWFIILKSIFRPVRQIAETDCHSDGANGAGRILPYILGAGFAFLISEVFQTPLITLDIPLLPTVIVFLLWLATFRFLCHYLSTGILTTDILRIGLFTGLLAFLIHCLADFNFYVQGLSMSVWFIGAIFLSTTESSMPLSFPPLLSFLRKQESRITAILIAFIVIVLSFITVRLIKYESFLEQGKVMLRSNVREERLVGVDYLGESFESNLFSVDVSVELAWAMHYVYSFSEVNEFTLTPLPICLTYIDFAISLNPLAPMLYNQQGMLCLEHAEQERKKGNKKMADIYEHRAKRAFQMFKELYPTYKDAKR